jgi:hypothetical protein
MHLLGHHFQVVGINGRPVSGAVGDTVHAPPLSPPLSLVAAGLLALGAPLRAQQSGMGMRDMPMGPGTMMGPGMMGMMRMMGDCPMMGMMMGADTSTFTEGRIAFLKAELAITDAQKAVWEAYAAGRSGRPPRVDRSQGLHGLDG